jgi:hypothetical protein
MLPNIRIGVREALKGQDLSFTEIAKLVGERWQVLRPDIRDACELEAATAKDKHFSELSKYKMSLQYTQYQQYLKDFKLKHTTPHSGKRRKSSNFLSPLESDTRPKGEQSSTETEPPREANSSAPCSDFNELDSKTPAPESITTPHQKSISNAFERPPSSSFNNSHTPSASTSPTTYFINTHSSITLHANSQQLISPVYTENYETYDLPHHARLRQPSAEFQTREATSAGDFQVTFTVKTQEEKSTSAGYFPAGSYSRWQRQSEKYNHQTLNRTHFPPDLPSPSGSFVLPPIQPNNTSPSPSRVLPPTPYQPALLPPLNAPKGDRTLPPALQSRTAGVNITSLDSRLIILPPSSYTSQLASQNSTKDRNGQHFYARRNRLVTPIQDRNNKLRQSEAGTLHHSTTI